MAAISCGLTILLTLVAAAASETKPMCEDVFPPPNSKLFMGKYNTYYTVRCDRGYLMQGNDIVKCIDGQWSSVPPICVLDPNADVCPDLDTPEHGSKQCSEGLLYPGTHCRFKCSDGYTLEGASIRLCMSNFRWSFLQPKCIPEITEDSYCTVPRPLKNGRVIGCSPKRIPTTGKTCHFSCNNGYVLQGPSALHCQSSGKLTDLDGNEATPECVALISSSSQSSEHENPSPLQRSDDSRDAQGSRRQRSQSYTSALPAPTTTPAYRSATTQRRRPDPRLNYPSCSKHNGGCEQKCIQRRESVQCRCRHGYALAADGKSCIDIDECSRESLNECQQTCHNIDGGYTCSCSDGYRKIGDHKCEGCGKDSYWQDEINRCVECPENSHTDSEAKLSIADCVCLPGFEGDPSEDIPCQDIDECAVYDFGCSHKCVNTPGSAYCSCPIGFTLDEDQKTCIDIDECSIKNGGCEGICHNIEGSFYCSCSEGYTTSNRDQYSCDDVDECLVNNGGCAQKCNNYPGGHYCSCGDGYRLDSGLQNCTDNQCPTLLTPHYASMTCRIKKKKLPQLESYPVGAACTFECLKNFKPATASNKVKCRPDGTWTGTVPECKPKNCPKLSVPENGDIHPPSCSRKGNSIKQKCTFTCHPGYHLKGKPVFSCQNNLTWTVQEIPECLPVKIQPTIKCPEDISVDLLPGRDTHNITLSAPITNVENVTIRPDWVFTETPVSFPAGTTNLVFTASHLKRFARCSTTVNVIDKEAPVFNFCTEQIEIDGVGAEGIQVTWDEPIVSDNVKVESLKSTLEPNTTLTPGTYHVKYIAKDGAGNVASCAFDIILNRVHCNDLADPVNGLANCMHWMSGKICTPTCNAGYARHPSEPMFYTCDDSGTWEPADVISNCLKYTSPASASSACPEGYEIVEHEDTGEEICMECQTNTVWSVTTRKCEQLDETILDYNIS